LYEYQGYGSHFDMMQGDNVIKNAKIIEKILRIKGEEKELKERC